MRNDGRKLINEAADQFPEGPNGRHQPNDKTDKMPATSGLLGW
jgi:hypothetical protein